jgi:hypothetical protein
MKALITGGCGQIGSHVAEMFHHRDAATSLYRGPSASTDRRTRRRRGVDHSRGVLLKNIFDPRPGPHHGGESDRRRRNNRNVPDVFGRATCFEGFAAMRMSRALESRADRNGKFDKRYFTIRQWSRLASLFAERLVGLHQVRIGLMHLFVGFRNHFVVLVC